MPFKLPIRLNKELAVNLLKEVDNFLFDCDGVIWNWPHAIPGSVEFINKLKSIGKKCYFITNNSTKTRKMVADQIKSIGIQEVHDDEIVCTSWVLAGYLKSNNFNDKIYVIGSDAIAHELNEANIRHVGIGSNYAEIPDPAKFDYKNLIKLDSEVKAVAVGFDYYFNYPKMVTATSYVHKVPGCQFIATNDDAVFPSGGDSKVVIPGTGTFVNALRTSIGREPVILGKPHRTMWNVLEKLHKLDPKRSCMIGDRLDTDIAFAANCSLGYSLAVLSGVTNENEIISLSNKVQTENSNNENAKLLPDFYSDCLGDFEKYIKNI